jgi:hypothetical protein
MEVQTVHVTRSGRKGWQLTNVVSPCSILQSVFVRIFVFFLWRRIWCVWFKLVGVDIKTPDCTSNFVLFIVWKCWTSLLVAVFLFKWWRAAWNWNWAFTFFRLRKPWGCRESLSSIYYCQICIFLLPRFCVYQNWYKEWRHTLFMVISVDCRNWDRKYS